MGEIYKQQKGYTLLEVLLSIILLSIILTSFMGFFTQSAIFTKKNEQKLGTSQTAQKVINLIEENVSKDVLVNKGIIDSAGEVTATTYLLANKAEIESIINETINSPYAIRAVITNNSSENLIQFKVIVADPDDSGSASETFTYIRR